jgi:hypothetical protein
MNWIPNTNPNLVGVFNGGDLLVPILSWRTGRAINGVTGLAVTGQTATVILDRKSLQVFSASHAWLSLAHYRAAPHA